MITISRYIELRNKHSEWENWIMAEFPSPKPTNYPKEYDILFDTNPDAYSYYRHSYFAFLKNLNGDDAILKDLMNLVNDLENKSSPKFEEIMGYLSKEEFVSKFKNRHKNSFYIQKERGSSQTLDHSLLSLYQSKYENEEILYVLVLLLDLQKKEIDNKLTRFRDKGKRLKKGVILNYLINNFNDYPNLQITIKKAYNTKLRNLIGHNNYVIKEQKILDMDYDNDPITRDEFFESLYNIQEIHSSILWIMSLVNTHMKIPTLKDEGIIKVSTGIEGDSNKPLLILDQLWCFFLLSDKESNFFNGSIELVINEGMLETKINNKLLTYVLLTDDAITNWIEVVKKSEISVVIRSIIPYIGGDEDKKLEYDCGLFEIVDYYTLNITVKLKGF